MHPLGPLAEPDAVALFTRHAAARGGATPATGDDVVRLCRALDHLPLAIELAAARARVLTVPEILARLDDRFALLTDTAAGRPARRRSLAAALAWSHDLLAPDDQRGLWALAAFPDGATLPALEHVLATLPAAPDIRASPYARVCDTPDWYIGTRRLRCFAHRGVPTRSIGWARRRGRLVERSLVVVDPGRRRGTRYRLLDSVRAFARERAAEAGVADVLADAVVGWVQQIAADVAAGVRGPDQAALVARTAAERATVDAALDRARQRRPGHRPGDRRRPRLGVGPARRRRGRCPAARRPDAGRTPRAAGAGAAPGELDRGDVRRPGRGPPRARRRDGARRRRPAARRLARRVRAVPGGPVPRGACGPRVVPGGVRGPRLRVGGGRQRTAGRLRPPRPGRHHRRAHRVRGGDPAS